MATRKKSTTKSKTGTTKRTTQSPKAAAKPTVEDPKQVAEIDAGEAEGLVAPEDRPLIEEAEAKAAETGETPQLPETTYSSEPDADELDVEIDVTDNAPAPAPVQGVTRAVPAVDAGNVGKLVKKDLVDRVIARSGVKPRYVRQVTEALLTELGQMIEEAETLQLQPLGAIKVQRRKDVGDGEAIIVKVKRKKDRPEDNDPLAAAAE